MALALGCLALQVQAADMDSLAKVADADAIDTDAVQAAADGATEGATGEVVAMRSSGEVMSVPVLTRTVKAGSVLSEADVAMTDVPAKRVFAGTARSMDAVVGKQLSRTLESGRTLGNLQLKNAATVARDSAVVLTYRKPGIALTSQAKALEDGAAGESIRVLNIETRATLLATVTGPGAVEIR